MKPEIPFLRSVDLKGLDLTDNDSETVEVSVEKFPNGKTGESKGKERVGVLVVHMFRRANSKGPSKKR